jgi:hypothetical protein
MSGGIYVFKGDGVVIYVANMSNFMFAFIEESKPKGE